MGKHGERAKKRVLLQSHRVKDRSTTGGRFAILFSRFEMTERLPRKSFWRVSRFRIRTDSTIFFIWMAEHGEIRNTEKFRKRRRGYLQGGQSKSDVSDRGIQIHSGSGQRIMAYLHGRQWVLTHGFRKGETLSVQTKRAKQLICEDLAGQSSDQRT